MAINAVAMAVEMAFGFGPGTTPASGNWVDVTQYLDVTPTSGSVTATSGRDSLRAGITAGKLTMRFENRDGRFNPRNASGPYYGKLDVGTQVRIRTTYSGTTRTRWLGFIDSGWPQTITDRWPTVTVTAHDLFGLLAQGDTPTSAWDAYVRASSPSHWWRPGADGWIDAITGTKMIHTSLLEQGSGEEDTIIAGEDAAWGQEESDGFGLSASSAVRVVTSTQDITVAARVKLPTIEERKASSSNGYAEPITIIAQRATSETPISINVYKEWLDIFAVDANSKREAYTPETAATFLLMDGRPHTLVVHIPADTGDIQAWVDGAEVKLTNVSTSDTYTVGFDDNTPFCIGSNGGNRPYTGYIDPVVIWRDIGKTSEQLTDFAAELHEAATVARAARRLDQRASYVLDDASVSAHLGTLDTSGIVTQQSYRQADALEQLQRIEETEQGRIWIDRSGTLRFSKRSWAWVDTVSTTVQVTFSDDSALIAAGTAQEMLEGGTVIEDDPLNIVNVAAVTKEGGRQQTVEDATSIAKHRRRNSIQLSGLLHPSDRQSRSIAEWLVLSQGSPKIQAQQVAFRVEDNPSVLAPIAAQIEEGWLVRIRKLTTADTLDLYAHVIGIEHEWAWTGWTVTLTLDATRASYSFFKWGTSNWGGTAGWAF